MPLLTVAVADEAGTRALAEDLAAVVRGGDVIALSGDLGMGKSAFARAFIRAVADDDAHEVPSPTFTLVQTYELPRLAVAHFDLYRLGSPEELREIGFDEAIRTSVTLVEWPERAGGDLPPDHLSVSIAPGSGPDGRVFTLDGPAEVWGARIERARRGRALIESAGLFDARRRHIQGDASTRSWERATAGSRTAILMTWPRRPPRPALRDGLPYEDLAAITDEPLAFVAISAGLRARGIHAAAVIAEDADARLLLLEDLGREGIVQGGVPMADRYVAAAAFLGGLPALDWPTSVVLPDGRVYTVPRYDRRALSVEADLMPAWYLLRARGRAADNGEFADWQGIWENLFDRVETGRPVWCLRDFHSPNILWQAGEDPPIGVIDIQDTVRGHPAYDVASLVTDARVDLPEDLVAAMLDAYADRRRDDDPHFDRAAFEEAVVILGAQRNAKILGRFVEYAERSGRTAHLRYLPRVRRNFEAALQHPVLLPLRLWYERVVPPA